MPDEDSNSEPFFRNLTFNYLRSKFEEFSIALTDENMKILRILSEDGYTHLGHILSDQYNLPLKVAVFNNEFKTNLIDRAEFTGCVLKQMDEALSFVSKYNGTSSVIEGLYRKDRRTFPEISVREAIVNAVVHRDYSLDDSIIVSVCPTEITVTSPGGMRRPYAPEELERGVSSIGNRNLAAIMLRLKIIGACGTGIPRIFSSYAGRPVKPTIESGGSSFTITLPADEDDNVSAVRAFLKVRDEFTRSELEESLNLSKSKAVETINRMLEDGAIVKIGQGRAIKYRLNRPV